MIVDSHTHIVSSDLSRYPLSPTDGVALTGQWFLEHPVDMATLLDEAFAADVAHVVLVQAISAYGTDNRYLLESASQAAGDVAIVAAVDPADPERMATEVASLLRRGVSALRAVYRVGPHDSHIGLPALRTLLQMAVEVNLPLVMFTGEFGIRDLEETLPSYPDARVVIDHCGFPPADRQPTIYRLAGIGGVFPKITTLNFDHFGGTDLELSVRFVEELTQRFGAERLLWGSDYPHTHDRPYNELVVLARQVASELPNGAAAKILGGTATVLWPTLGTTTQSTASLNSEVADGSGSNLS